MKRIVIFALMIFLCGSVYAVSGVNPRSYEIDFVPNYKEDLILNFFIDGNSEVDLSVEGDLAKYVSLDKDKISGREKVIASMKLPSVIDSPGANQIKIVAGDIVSLVKINVPYPEEYVELELSAPNIDAGELNNIILKASSKGNGSVFVNSRIEVYSLGNLNESIDSFDIRKTEIVSGNTETFEWMLDSSNYSAGNYLAVASINYSGKIARAENLFRVGISSVRILNYTKEFKEGKVGKFEIEVESLSNKAMNKLFANVNVIGFEEANFATTNIRLGAWDSATLVGFLDTNKVSDYNIEAEIILHYDDKTESQIVELKILEKFDYVLLSVLVVFMSLVVFIGWKEKNFLKKYRKYKK